MTELDTYAIPEAHNPAFATGFGDLSGHEVATSATDSRLLYFSYYSGGFRVAKITADEKLQEVGHYIDTGGNNFWGVQVPKRRPGVCGCERPRPRLVHLQVQPVGHIG